MSETQLRFGRLDFLLKDDEMLFLELNPNGQFAWLDPEGNNGMLNALADEIRFVWKRSFATQN
jgi:hypothetical protein